MRHHLQKIARAKWTGSVAQEAEYLLCKHEALLPKTELPYNLAIPLLNIYPKEME
jgi:hypothetical protein